MHDAPAYDRPPLRVERAAMVEVSSFLEPARTADEKLIADFAREWGKFDRFNSQDLERIGVDLFDLLPSLKDGCKMIDIGCGGGRWSRLLSRRVAHIDAVDPSDAILTAASVNSHLGNIRWSRARGEDLPFGKGSFDLAICIGVLHHMKDPELLLQEAQRLLKTGGKFYFYIYYALNDRGVLFRSLYRLSDRVRRWIHPLPYQVKYGLTQFIAVTIYLPLVSLARMARIIGVKGWERIPLSFYHDKSFRIMRNDALDRFGTSVERRYTREQIQNMLLGAGFGNVQF
nr:class I SAM-dependent methyltransferase [Bacteroidota bacterium]